VFAQVIVITFEHFGSIWLMAEFQLFEMNFGP
jgi:hypothetical protein